MSELKGFKRAKIEPSEFEQMEIVLGKLLLTATSDEEALLLFIHDRLIQIRCAQNGAEVRRDHLRCLAVTKST